MKTPRIGQLIDHRYGKVGVRLLRLDRSGARHSLFEATVSISLEGDFAEAHAEGDNRRVLPTDTMKNTVYGLAREQDFETSEAFAFLLARHFVSSQEQVARATVRIAEKPWQRHGGNASTFVAGGEERFMTKVVVDVAGSVSINSGISGLVILKSSDSGFAEFPRDRFTTLQETDDRIFSTSLEARWDFSLPADTAQDSGVPDSTAAYLGGLDFAAIRERTLTALLDAFAEHESRSVQHTLYWMGETALAAVPEIERIFLRMPNRHYLLAKLDAFDLDNPNRVFVPIDEPAGMIEGTIERAGGC